MPDNKKKRKGLVDSVTYAYIRKVKKWMFCPNCHEGKMAIDKKSTVWICGDCGYQLSTDEFEDNYVFWFCDNCDEYLNNQEGFERSADRHICRNCGYENDTTLNNIKGICSDCGAVIADPEATLCPDCKHSREQKAKEWLAKAGKVVGVVTAVAGAAAYLASQISSDDFAEDDTNGISPKKDWLKSASEDELRARKKKSVTAQIGVLDQFWTETLTKKSKQWMPSMRKSIKGLGISTIAKITLMKVMGFTVNTVGIYQMMTKANGW